MSEAVDPVSREQWGAFLRRVDGEESMGEPAAESVLADLESRLGRALPADYRNFLATTDGYEGGRLYRIYPAAEVGWAREVIPDVIEAWEDFDDELEMLQRCAVVGADDSNAFYLINPVPGGEGWTAIEWWTTPSEIADYPTFGALAAALASSDQG